MRINHNENEQSSKDSTVSDAILKDAKKGEMKNNNQEVEVSFNGITEEGLMVFGWSYKGLKYSFHFEPRMEAYYRAALDAAAYREASPTYSKPRREKFDNYINSLKQKYNNESKKRG